MHNRKKLNVFSSLKKRQKIGEIAHNRYCGRKLCDLKVFKLIILKNNNAMQVECCGSTKFWIRIRSEHVVLDPDPYPIRRKKLDPRSEIESGPGNIRRSELEKYYQRFIKS